MKPTNLIALYLVVFFIGCGSEQVEQKAKPPETTNGGEAPVVISKKEKNSVENQSPRSSEVLAKAKRKESASSIAKPKPTVRKNPTIDPESKTDEDKPTGNNVPSSKNTNSTGTLTPQATPKPEPQPVSWLQRMRFWNMAGRVVARRNRELAEFDEAEFKRCAIALKNVKALHQHIDKLRTNLYERGELARSKFFKESILASLRGEMTLPKGTRTQHKKLFSANNFERANDISKFLEILENKFINQNISKGDMLLLSFGLREHLVELRNLRRKEITQDEFFLMFPSRNTNMLERRKIWGWYPDVRKKTVRELWTATPPDWFVKEHSDLHQAWINQRDGKKRPYSITRKNIGPALKIMSDLEFNNLVALADWFEEKSGGPDRLLVFPKIEDLPSRNRVIEASKRNLAAVKKADEEALREMRASLHSKLTDQKKELLIKVKDNRTPRIDLINLDRKSSVYSVVIVFDHAINGKLGVKLFYKWQMPIEHIEEYYKRIQKKRNEVFDTGAKFYFDLEKSK